MEIAAHLRREAQAVNERRLLVLTGTPKQTRVRALEAIRAAAISAQDTVYLGPEPIDEAINSDYSAFTHISPTQYQTVLGSTQEAVILDCHDRCEPNILGGVTGTVAGGGLLLLLVPPFDQWVETRDGFDETLAVPPYSTADVGTTFRERLIATLKVHPGIAIIDAETRSLEKTGLTNPPPRLPTEELVPPETRLFPTSAYEACLTQDQQDALFALEALETEPAAVVIEAHRGRGKSSVAGLASAALALDGADVLVTAPKRTHANVLFEQATTYFESVGEISPQENTAQSHGTDTIVTVAGGRIRYVPPQKAKALPDDPDCVIVDEAAGIPVGTLSSLLSCDRLAFLTTVHGYEGTGRGFAVRFRERLVDSRHAVTDISLLEPIRYASGDPLEVWSFRALCLHGRPPVAPAIEDATVESVEYRSLSPATLQQNEPLLQELFGLLVLAHYHTEPNDLARLLDAPNVSVHALLYDGHPVSVALLAKEGGLSETVRRAMYEGRRVRGNLIPDLLASQLRDESAPKQQGYRILRIATHEAVRSRGLGSHLLAQLRERALSETTASDWLGVSFGATPRLISFWEENGFRTVHLSTSKNDRSGEHSAVMLDPLSEAGEPLLARHTDWFYRRFPATVSDSLSTVDPDIILAVCRATAGQVSPDLTTFEWRILSGLGNGAAIFETAPRAVRQLAFQYLTDPTISTETLLSATEERLLVMKALQARPWEVLRDELGYHSRAATMRALGAAVDKLVVEYGDPTIQADRERLRK